MNIAKMKEILKELQDPKFQECYQKVLDLELEIMDVLGDGYDAETMIQATIQSPDDNYSLQNIIKMYEEEENEEF